MEIPKMTPSPSTRIIFVAVSLLVAFAFGRFTTPVKIKTVVKTVTVTKDVNKNENQSDKNTHKKVVQKEIDKPDGTKEIDTTTTEETDQSNKNKSETVAKTDHSQEQEKEVAKGSGRLTLSVLGGVNLHDIGSPLLGLAVTKSILGPITIGAWGLNDNTIGVSVGLDF